jgi:hypothetical protein
LFKTGPSYVCRVVQSPLLTIVIANRYTFLKIIQTHQEYRLQKNILKKPLVKDNRLLPNTWVDKVRSKMVLLIACYIFVMAPSALAFKSISWLKDLWYLDVGITMVLTLNSVCRLFTSYYDSDGFLVTDLLMIKKRYFEFGGLQELMAALPLGLLVYHIVGEHNVYTVNIFALNRMSLVMHHLREYWQMIVYYCMHSNVSMLSMMIAMLHVLACFWFLMGSSMEGGWYLTMVSELPAEIAAAAVSGNEVVIDYAVRIDSTLLEKYLISFYYVFNILTNYGMVITIPTTYLEGVYTMFIMTLSLTVMAFVRAYISINMMQREEAIMNKRMQQELLANFVKRAELPEVLRGDIEHFYQNDSDSGTHQPQVLYNGMSYYLRVEIAKRMCLNILDSVRLFSHCTPCFLDALTVHLNEVYLPPAPSQSIFIQKEIPKHMYILRSGTVVVTTTFYNPEYDGEAHADRDPEEMSTSEKVSEPGEVLGQLSFFFQIPHINTASTLADSAVNLLSLEQQAFTALKMNFRDDENTIAENCLVTYDKAKSSQRDVADAQSSSPSKVIN